MAFTRELARHGMTDGKILLQQLKQTDVAVDLRKIIESRIRHDDTQAKQPKHR